MVRGFGLLLVVGIALAFALRADCRLGRARARRAATAHRGRLRAVAAGRRCRGRPARCRGALGRGGGQRGGTRRARAARRRRTRRSPARHRCARSGASPPPSRRLAHPRRLPAPPRPRARRRLRARRARLDRRHADARRLRRAAARPGRTCRRCATSTTLQDATDSSGEIDVLVRGKDVASPRVVRWMSDYQQRVLSHFGYAEAKGCRDRDALPGVLAAGPVPGHERDEREARSTRCSPPCRRTSPPAC